MSKELILTITQELLERAGFPMRAQWVEGTFPRVSLISTQDCSVLIGKEGQHLHALEHLVRALVTKHAHEPPPDFTIDVNNYRGEQIQRLAMLAHQCAEKVIASGHAESLEPMNAFERKIIHTELSARGDLITQSIGEEPHRRIVIKRATW